MLRTQSRDHRPNHGLRWIIEQLDVRHGAGADQRAGRRGLEIGRKYDRGAQLAAAHQLQRLILRQLLDFERCVLAQALHHRLGQRAVIQVGDADLHARDRIAARAGAAEQKAEERRDHDRRQHADHQRAAVAQEYRDVLADQGSKCSEGCAHVSRSVRPVNARNTSSRLARRLVNSWQLKPRAASRSSTRGAAVPRSFAETETSVPRQLDLNDPGQIPDFRERRGIRRRVIFQCQLVSRPARPPAGPPAYHRRERARDPR